MSRSYDSRSCLDELRTLLLSVGLQARVSRAPHLRSLTRAFSDGERQRDEAAAEEDGGSDERKTRADQVFHPCRPQEREAEEHSEQPRCERDAGDDADGSTESGLAHGSSTSTANS